MHTEAMICALLRRLHFPPVVVYRSLVRGKTPGLDVIRQAMLSLHWPGIYWQVRALLCQMIDAYAVGKLSPCAWKSSPLLSW